MVSALYGILAASSSSRTKRVLNGCLGSRRVGLFRREHRGGDERPLLTYGTSFCVPDNTPAQRIAGKMWTLESEPPDALRTLGHRRISVHESSVVVWVCKNQWEKDGKGNETNLGVFGHLLPAKSVMYYPPLHEYVSPVSLTA